MKTKRRKNGARDSRIHGIELASSKFDGRDLCKLRIIRRKYSLKKKLFPENERMRVKTFGILLMRPMELAYRHFKCLSAPLL